MALTKRKLSEGNAVTLPPPLTNNESAAAPVVDTAPATPPPAPATNPLTLSGPVPMTAADRPARTSASPSPVAGLAVPATKTPAELLAERLHNTLVVDDQNTLALWMGQREIVSTWVEPTADQKKALIRALINERGIDPTEDYEGVAAAKAEIDAKIAKERAEAGLGKQDVIDRMYLEAAYLAFMSAATTARLALEKKGGKVHKIVGSSGPSSKPRVTGSKRGRKSNWAQKNPKLIEWAKKHGMADYVLVDKTDGGFKGSYHAIRALENGTWERVEYNPIDHSYTPMGVIVDRPLWFNDIDTGERVVGYSPYQMYEVLMYVNGKPLTIPGVSVENRIGMGDMAQVYGELGIGRGK